MRPGSKATFRALQIMFVIALVTFYSYRLSVFMGWPVYILPLIVAAGFSYLGWLYWLITWWEDQDRNNW